MHPAEYAEFLTARIGALESQLQQYQPDWEVPSLKRSYVDLTVYGTLANLYDWLATG